MILTGIRVPNFGRLLTCQFVTSYSFCSMYVVYFFNIFFERCNTNCPDRSTTF